MVSQKDGVLSLVQGDKGKQWAENLEGWSADAAYSICYWYGIICDSETEKLIIGISLNNEEIHGTIPAELGSLKHLRTLSLAENMLTGSIPQVLFDLPNLEVLRLSKNNISGHLPTLKKSISLKVLDLGHNLLWGKLPANMGDVFGKMTELVLTQNMFQGPIPKSIGLMSSLETLWLSGNKLSGTIPSYIKNVKNLEFLYLDSNYLQGTIPPEIASLSLLEELWLQKNELSGTIPAALSELPLLEYLYIEGNKFMGTVPDEICVESLNKEFFEDVPEGAITNICDSIACPVGEASPEGLFPCKICEESLFNPYLGRVGKCLDTNEADTMNLINSAAGGMLWTKGKHCDSQDISCDSDNRVISISLQNKGLRGKIPPEIGYLQFLARLDLSGNMLTGLIPFDLQNAPIQILHISGNQLIGIVPPMLCTKSINSSTDGKSSCESIACPVGTYSSSGTGFSPDKCVLCPDGEDSYVGAQSCFKVTAFGQTVTLTPPDENSVITDGVIADEPKGIKTAKDILLTFVQGKDGEEWAEELEGWSEDAKYDVCFWDGIICEPDSKVITEILLNRKGITGKLSSHLGKLKTLKVISLAENSISGSIPQEIADLPSLESITLSKNKLDGSIPQFKSKIIRVIDFKFNRLRTLPENIGKYNNLVDFEVTHNAIQGTIPKSFGMLSNLESLSLSENHLTGTIPSNLGDAISLLYLYLDNNLLVGTIPPKLAKRDSPMLEIWLQKNKLSGTIPASLGEFDDLFNFYIDSNKFTGTIPSELCNHDINSDFFNDAPVKEKRDYCESISCGVGKVSFDGLYPCHLCPDRSSNPYLGHVGECFEINDSAIMEKVNNMAKGTLWETDQYCKYETVTCSKAGNVVEINLSAKLLRGTIPPEIGFLKTLRKLDLSDNIITGFVPSDLRFAPLEFLDISGNNLIGMIPPMLCMEQGINENGLNGRLRCDTIACPVGKRSPNGRASLTGGEECVPCIDGQSSYLGTKDCMDYLLPPDKPPKLSLKGYIHNHAMSPFAIFVTFFVTVIGVVGCLCASYYMNKQIIESANLATKDQQVIPLSDHLDASLGEDKPNKKDGCDEEKVFLS